MAMVKNKTVLWVFSGRICILEARTMEKPTQCSVIWNYVHMKGLFFHQIKQQQARLAQSVARETLNLKVVGSSPTSGCSFLPKKVRRSDRWLSRYRSFFPGWIGWVECGGGALAYAAHGEVGTCRHSKLQPHCTSHETHLLLFLRRGSDRLLALPEHLNASQCWHR